MASASSSPSALRTRSGIARSASTSSSSGIDPVLEERLSSLLASPDFTVSHYLNIALAPTTPAATSSETEDAEQQLEQRMASLALQLQMRTQSCHDEIGRIGAGKKSVPHSWNVMSLG